MNQVHHEVGMKGTVTYKWPVATDDAADIHAPTDDGYTSHS